MPTSDELLRTQAPRFDYEVRFFVGAKHKMIEAENLFLGESFSPFQTTLLSADIDSFSTSIPVADTSGFTLGAVVVEVLDSNEMPEFVKYTESTQQSFTGLTRELPAQPDDSLYSNQGSHKAGASVSEFIEITEKVTRMNVDFTEQNAVSSWRARLDGRNYNSFLLDNDNSVMCQVRFKPSAGDYDTWTAWKVWWVGYIKDCEVTDTGSKSKEWSANVEGLSQYAKSTECDPRHFGKNDLAEGKSVTESSYLEDPFLEYGTGEYNGFPLLDGSQVNDDDLGTLWISEGEPSPVQEGKATAVAINEVFLRPRAGFVNRDHQWIELYFYAPGASERLGRYCLCNKNTTFKRQGDYITWNPITQEYELRHSDEWVPETNYVQLGGGNMDTETGAFAILTFNLPKFLQRYPNHGAQHVVDMRADIFGTFELDVTGDYLLLKYQHVLNRSTVWWTDGTDPSWGWVPQMPDLPDRSEGVPWSGNMIVVPPRGHSFRRQPTGQQPAFPSGSSPDSDANWLSDEIHPTPGYHTSSDPEWISVDLGEMGITLEEDLAAGETGTVYLNKQPLGLQSSGYVRINEEVIGYTGRSDTANTITGLTRGLFGTSVALHPEESVVEAWDSADSDATSHHLVSSVSWRRRPVQPDGGGANIVPNIFEVYVSNFIEPILPDSDDWDEEVIGEGGWQDYWEKVCNVNGWAQTSWVGAFEPRRVRHAMLMIKGMSDTRRAKLNQFHVWADQVDVIASPRGEDDDDQNTVYIDGTYSGYVIKEILNKTLGMAPSQFTMTDEGRPFVDLHTTKSSTMQLIRDLCGRTGCSVVFAMDGSIEHRFDPFYPMAGLEDVEITWNRDYARSVSMTRPYRHNVRQVVVRAHEPETDERFEAEFPDLPLDFGSTLEIEDWVLSDPTDAGWMAQYIFRHKNAPLTAVVTPIGPAEWVRPGQRHVINWTLDAGSNFLINRNFVVTGVQWTMNFGEGNPGAKDWRTSVTLKELIF